MKKRVLLIVLGALLCALIVGFCLLWEGVILLNKPSKASYPVRGVDVSRYQGEIDWQVLAMQDIDFAFVKATEGSGTLDPCFEQNLAGAQAAGLRVGAYHFFSFDSPGETQADNFIGAVKKSASMLPPVVDIELYAAHKKNPPEQAYVREQLDVLLSRLEAQYGVKPILYVTKDSYRLYISGSYLDYELWVRDVVQSPKWLGDREWTFWQYTNREKLKGYRGEERFIDMNVYHASADAFAQYPN